MNVDPCVPQVLPGLLSCDETRTFWLGWRDGRVRLGSGFKYGREELLAMAIPSGVHFNALSLSNANVTGHWEFDSDYGECDAYMHARTHACTHTKIDTKR